MALQKFPFHLAKVVLDDYGLGADVNQLGRTAIASGPPNQRPAQVQFKTRTFDILVRESDLKAFRGWLDQHGHEWLLYPDVDDHVERQVRIVGGTVALQRQRDLLVADRKAPERCWRGVVQLEGFSL
ncbi:MAG: hypothetical protein OXC31_11070 [Spirochaetaceae bacterium]|nr:hypothetical protein [Spirochaetaceae bacterium]